MKRHLRAFLNLPVGVSGEELEFWNYIYMKIVECVRSDLNQNLTVEVFRLDILYFSPAIQAHAMDCIRFCDLMIAVCVFRESNDPYIPFFFWSLGFAEGLGRPIIYILKETNDSDRSTGFMWGERIALNGAERKRRYIKFDPEAFMSPERVCQIEEFKSELNSAISYCGKISSGYRLPSQRSQGLIFFGYCNKSHDTALAIKDFILNIFKGFKFLDWKWDFRSSGVLIGDRASKTVSAAIFLITKDDIIEHGHGSKIAVSRDNVIFEIGYFASRLGLNRVILIVEAGVKIRQI